MVRHNRDSQELLSELWRMKSLELLVALAPVEILSCPSLWSEKKFSRKLLRSFIRSVLISQKEESCGLWSIRRGRFLLCGPHVKKVPRQGARAWIIENDHSVVGQELRKEWNEVQVLATLKEAFDEQIPHDVDFEIVMSCHNQLVKPALAPGQNGLNGKMVHRIFKESKPLYLRPARNIFSDPYNPVSDQITWYHVSSSMTYKQIPLIDS